MGWKLSNATKGVLLQAAEAAALTLYIDPDIADTLPVLSVGDKAKGVLLADTYYEIVNITAVVDGALTVERATESTVARDWPAGTKFIHTPTAEVLQGALNAAIGTSFAGTSSMVANAYTVDVGTGNTIPSFNSGEQVSFIIDITNTGAATLVVTNGVDSTISKPIVWQDGIALRAGDFAADWKAVVIADTVLDAWVLVTDASRQEYAEKLNGGPVPAVNRLPNGRHAYWTTATSFVTPASNTETADGWYVQYDGTIGAFTISRQAFTPGQTTVPDNPRYFYRWDQSGAGSGSTYRRIRVPIPGVHWRAGDNISFGFWAKADTNRNVDAKVVQYFGTGGGPSADVTVVTETLALTNQWQFFDLADTVMPALTGKTIGSGGDDSVDLYIILPNNVTMTIDIAMADAREGPFAGLQSDTFPLAWRRGGVGGAYASLADFVSKSALLTTTAFAAYFAANYPDVAAIEATSSNGFATRTAANTWANRTFQDTTGITWTNPAGIAGDPSFALSTGLQNYHADPMSPAELASISGVFGTAAFVADSGIVHIAGTETITGAKTFSTNPSVTNASPQYLLNESDQASDEKVWSVDSTSKVFRIASRTDANGAGVTALSIARGTGTAVTSINMGVVAQGADGSVTTPTWSFTNDSNTGLYSAAADAIGFVAGGTERWRLTSGHLVSWAAGVLQAGDGTAGLPGLTFASDSDNGFYRIGADNIALSIGNSKRIDFASTIIEVSTADFRIAVNPATLAANSAGFRAMPVSSGEKSGAYSTVLQDCGGAIPFTASATLTIALNSAMAAPIGSWIWVPNLNGSGTLTIHPETGVTLRRGDGVAGTGDRTVAADSGVWLWKRGTNEWYIYGLFA